MSNEKRERAGTSHAWLAWILFALTIVFLVGALVFSVLIGPRPDQDLGFRAAFGGFSLVGLLIALRRPGNALGWLCSAIGISITASFFLDQIVWSALTTGSAGLPAVQWVGLFSKQVLQDIGWAGLYLVPMLFPTGRFLSSRWRLAGLSGIALLLLITSMDALVAPTLSGYALPIANPLQAAVLGHAWSMARPLVLVPSTLLLFVALPAPPVRGIAGRNPPSASN